MTIFGHLGPRASRILVAAAVLASCRPAGDDRPRRDDAVVRAAPADEASTVKPAGAGEAEHRLAAAHAEAPASAKPRLLVLGDSNVFGGFGTALEENLRARGADVWLHGSCGASSVSFLRGIRSECGAVHHEPSAPTERVTGPAATPKIDSLLASVRPDAAVLVLGTNFLCCSAQAAPDVRELVDRLAQAQVPCLWVGLPSFKEPPSPALVRHYAMLEEALANKCTLLDARSLGITFRHVGDKVHVEPESGRAWAEAVANATFLLPTAR